MKVSPSFLYTPALSNLDSPATRYGNLGSRIVAYLQKNLTFFWNYLTEKINYLFSFLIFSRTKETKEIAEIGFAHLQTLCSQAFKHLDQRSSSKIGPVQQLFASPEIMVTSEKCAALITELMAEFTKHQKEFGAKKTDSKLHIAYRAQVPAYFANAPGSQSAYQRKYLALAGIRNLLHIGPQIIDDFAQKLFIGGERNYAEMRGLKAYKHYTGNTFDLDFEFDAESDEEAKKIAEGKIQQFMKLLGLQEEERKDRKLDIELVVPQSDSHKTRSHTGLWKRQTPLGKTHYYVNVPNLDLAVYATLTLPYLLAEMVYKEKQKNGDILEKEFLDRLFHDGISDKCFNDKAATLGNFYATWKSTSDSSAAPITSLEDRIKRGDLGEVLKETEFKTACEEAYTRNTLIGELEEIRGEEDWGKKDPAFFVELLAKDFSGEYPRKLYRTDDQSNDFAPFSKNLLINFIKNIYLPYISV